jgi:hypothetical protein
MFDKIHIYHFLLNNGQEYYGKVLAHDKDKIIIDALGKIDRPKRMILYQNFMVLAERMEARAC